jgi:class 3 adenylate cyclase
MSSLWCTVIMKTDLRESTARVSSLSRGELSSLLTGHKQLVLDIVEKHEGRVVKGAGDAFWITFPSVTAAAIAAREIHEELRFAQTGKTDDERLAVRLVITLGDVLHQDADIFGSAVNLAARIEELTPADETYLSEAAWLAMNRAEIRTIFVSEVTLRGFEDTHRLHRLEHEHATRILEDEVMVFSDLGGFTAYVESHSTADVERLLLHLESIHTRSCSANGGTARGIAGDSYFLTFPGAPAALQAIESACGEWQDFMTERSAACPMRFGLHRGTIFLFRSFLYGRDVNFAARLVGVARQHAQLLQCCVLASAGVMAEVAGTCWEDRFERVDVAAGDQLGDVREVWLCRFT